MIKIIFVLIGILFFANHFSRSETRRSFGRRDPFIPLVGGARQPFGSGIEDIRTVDDVNFEGVVSDAEGRRNAIINGELIKEGQKKGIVKIVEVKENEIIIEIEGIRHHLRLFD